MSFKFARDVLEMDLPDPGDKSYIRILNLKQSVASSVFTATTRVRAGDLRDREDDGLDSFLRQLREEAGEDEEIDASVLFN